VRELGPRWDVAAGDQEGFLDERLHADLLFAPKTVNV